jgi:hypothetical protein
MLKYQPKRFWGMLRGSKPSVGVSAEEFAKFNEQLYYNEQLPEDRFELPVDIEKAKVTTQELQTVLELHYPANRSTGLSHMPTQCIKWLGPKALPTIAEFINKSAIE